ncbi:MAG: ABC transporter permease [Desulforhopalus sp.]|nr:ABC transporter permease [Desulforhopalus sp.]
MNFFEYVIMQKAEILTLTLRHLEITGMSVLMAVAIGVPVGIMITRFKKSAGIVLGIANIFQTLPSLALFGLIIPIMGIGYTPSVFVLFLYALLPIIKNTYLGIDSVDPAIIDAGKGMGMTDGQILGTIEIPLSLPVIMGGVRISTVINIGTATIAALIGAGGLGDLIFKGISMNNTNMILAGAIPTALLAIGADYLLGWMERRLTPTGVSAP